MITKRKIITNGPAMLIGAGLTVAVSSALDRANNHTVPQLPLYAQILGGALLGYVTKKHCEYSLLDRRSS